MGWGSQSELNLQPTLLVQWKPQQSPKTYASIAPTQKMHLTSTYSLLNINLQNTVIQIAEGTLKFHPQMYLHEAWQFAIPHF